MSNPTPVPDLEPRPLLFALWFRTLVVLCGAALVAVLVIPPVLHLAGTTVFETSAATPPPTSKELVVVRAVLTTLSHPLVLVGLGLLAGISMGWLSHAHVRPSLTDSKPMPPAADARRPRLDECAAIAWKLVEELEALRDILKGPSRTPMPGVVSPRHHSSAQSVPRLSPADRDAA